MPRSINFSRGIRCLDMPPQISKHRAMKKPAKRMGRPPKPPDQKFIDVGLKLPPAMLQRIDAITGKDAEHGVDRSTVIRRLIAVGLDAESRRGKVTRGSA